MPPTAVDLEGNDEPEQLSPFLSSNGAMMTIIKCAIGAGSFSLPRAFMDGGVYLSFFFTLFLGLLSAYTILVLMDSSVIASKLVKLQSQNTARITDLEKSNKAEFVYAPITDDPIYRSSVVEDVGSVDNFSADLTYPEVGALAFPEALISWRGRRCNLAYLIISWGILLTSLGVCAAYVDFISDTLPDVLRNITQNEHLFLSRTNTPWIIMPFLLGLSFLRTLKVLTYTSLIGNIAVFSGCIGVIIYGYFLYRADLTFNHNFVEWKTLPKYVGGNTFLFAIHVVILPIMQQMDGSDGSRKIKYVVTGSFSFITIFNALFGAVGFLLFASSKCSNVDNAYIGPCDNILSNMSGGNVLDTVRILVCIDLLFTVPLILAASRVIIEKHILDSDTARRLDRLWSRCSQGNAARNDCSESESELVETIRFQTASDQDCCPTGVESRWIGGTTFSHDREHTMLFNADCSSNCSESKDTIDIKTKAVNAEDFILLSPTTAIVTGDVKRERDSRVGSAGSKLFTCIIQYTVRTALVTSVVLMSVCVPQFGDMVDLVGGLVMPLTCFLLPSAMNIRLWHHIDQLTASTSSSSQYSAGGELCQSTDTSSVPRGSSGDAPLIAKRRSSMSSTQYFLHMLIISFGLLTMIATTALTLSAK